jgi:hypothetical protein
MTSLHRVVLAVLLAVGLVACKGRPCGGASEGSAGAVPSSSKLTDLSSSLDAARTAFNARKQEARFLTLLSPT